MSEISVQEHVLYALRNATINRWPFPHFQAKNVFPATFYANLVLGLSQNRRYEAAAGKYANRTFASDKDFLGCEFMQSPEFLQNIASLFTHMKANLGGAQFELSSDLRFIRDGEGYSIGPHTDAAWKVVSLLFYLPADFTHTKHGTSIYLPKNRDFRCPGGPHHKFEDFDRVHTAPYFPNSCFGFLKTAYSFHGVEPINEPIQRDVLLYNIYANPT